ncbi:Uncharacterised protein [Paucimonas lemoignei]|nr:Uncharacterised protein [Paucimonas lemoignei]
MRTQILTISTGRRCRLALGSVVLLAGVALLVSQGLEWLNFAGL